MSGFSRAQDPNVPPQAQNSPTPPPDLGTTATAASSNVLPFPTPSGAPNSGSTDQVETNPQQAVSGFAAAARAARQTTTPTSTIIAPQALQPRSTPFQGAGAPPAAAPVSTNQTAPTPSPVAATAAQDADPQPAKVAAAQNVFNAFGSDLWDSYLNQKYLPNRGSPIDAALDSLKDVPNAKDIAEKQQNTMHAFNQAAVFPGLSVLAQKASNDLPVVGEFGDVYNGAPSQTEKDYVSSIVGGVIGGVGAYPAAVGEAGRAGAAAVGRHLLTAMNTVESGGDVAGSFRALNETERGMMAQYIRANPEQRAQMHLEQQRAALEQNTPNAAIRIGKDIQDYANTNFAVPPERQTFGMRVAGGAAGFATMLPGIAAGAAVGGPAGASATGALMIGMQSYDSTLKEAQAAGATQTDAEHAAGVNALTQMGLMALPLGHVISRFPELGSGLVKTLQTVAKSGIEMGGFNGLAQTADNYIAMHTFDPHRGLFDNVPEATATGAVIGGFMGTAGAAWNAVRFRKMPAGELVDLANKTGVTDGDSTGPIPVVPPRTVHTMVRQEIAPDLFREYDPLMGELQTARAELDAHTTDLVEQAAVAASPHADEIRDIRARMADPDTTPEVRERDATRLGEILPEHEEHLATVDRGAILESDAVNGDAHLRELRDQVSALGDRVNDLAPQVREAYQRAANQIVLEVEANHPFGADVRAARFRSEDPETPVAVRERDAVRMSEVGPEFDRYLRSLPEDVQRVYRDTIARPHEESVIPPLATHPEAPPTEPVRSIMDRVTDALVKAGRPQEEAEAGASLVHAMFETLSRMFGGRHGTPEDWFRRVGPGIVGVHVLGETGTASGHYDPLTRIIRLAKIADHSTFVHELAHYWTDIMTRLARERGAPDAVREDLRTLRRFARARGSRPLTEVQQERIARAFETYLREGRAPSRALDAVFAKFREWITAVYKVFKEKRVQLSDDVRGVFDRWLAHAPERTAITPDEEGPTPPRTLRQIMEQDDLGEVAARRRQAEETIRFRIWQRENPEAATKFRRGKRTPESFEAPGATVDTGAPRTAPEAAPVAEAETEAPPEKPEPQTLEELGPAPKVPIGAKQSEIHAALVALAEWQEKKRAIEARMKTEAEVAPGPVETPPAEGAAAVLAELDARNATDIEYRDALSTGAKDPLKPGETWRDRLIRVARSQREEETPKSLNEFLQETGGISEEHPDVEAAGLHDEEGRSLGQAAQDAQAAGYMPELQGHPAGPAELADAIREENEGTPQHTEEGAASLKDFDANAATNDSMVELAHDLGIDPEGLTAAQLIAAIRERAGGASFEEIARDAEEQAAGAASDTEQRLEDAGSAIAESVDAHTEDELERLYRESVESGAVAGMGDRANGNAGPEPAPVATPAGENEPGRGGAGTRDAGQSGEGPREAPGAEPKPAAGREPPAGGGGAGGGESGRKSEPLPSSKPNATLAENKKRMADGLPKIRNLRVEYLTEPEMDDALRAIVAELNLHDEGKTKGGMEFAALHILYNEASTKFDAASTKFLADPTTENLSAYEEAKQQFAMAHARLESRSEQWGYQGYIMGRIVREGMKARAEIAAVGDLSHLTLFQVQERIQAAQAEIAAVNGLDTPEQQGNFLKQRYQQTRLQKALVPVMGYYLSSVLSNAISHGGYAVGNIVSTMFKASVIPVQATFGLARAALPGATVGRVYYGELPAAVFGMGWGLARGVVPAYRAFMSGEVLMRGISETPLPYNQMITGPNMGLSGRAADIATIAGKIFETPLRSVQAIHVLTYSMAHQTELARLAYRDAMERTTPDSVPFAEFGAHIQAFVNNPPDWARVAAHQEALGTVLMKPPPPGSLRAQISNTIRSTPGLSFIALFTNIGNALVEQSVRLSPLAIASSSVRGMLRGEVPGTGVADMGLEVRRLRQASAAALAANDPLQAQQLRDRAARLAADVKAGTYQPMRHGGQIDTAAGSMVAGSMLGVAVASLAAQGLITGPLSSDPKKRQLQEDNGERAYSFRWGELNIPYLKITGGLAPLLGMAATIGTASQYVGEDHANYAARAVADGFKEVVFNEMWFKQIHDLLDGVVNNDAHLGSVLKNFATSWLPWSSGLSGITRQVDPYQRQTQGAGFWDGLAQSFIARIPFASEELAPQIGPWGQPVLSHSTIGPSQMRHDPVDERMLALGIGKPLPEHSINGVTLTPSQFDDYRKKYGVLAHDLLLPRVTDAQFLQLPPGVQIHDIELYLGIARKQAEAAMRADPNNPELLPDATALRYRILQIGREAAVDEYRRQHGMGLAPIH